jgi:ubiquinone/menaquinone biosynthesis C-methylase UbiE
MKERPAVIAVDDLKRAHRATWAAGDYPAVAEMIDEAPPRDLLDRVDIHPGEDVLDVATGTGNAALRAAAAGANVVGLDLTPELFERARSREAELGVEIDWVEGDAEALPFADESFDAVISNGVIDLIPDKEAVFAEIFRVLTPGGRIQIADVTIQNPVSAEGRRNIDLWTG